GAHTRLSLASLPCPLPRQGASPWRYREALEEYRRSVETPRGVLLFRVVGAEPLLMMFEVVQEVTAATRLPEAARARRVGTDFSLVASSPSTCDDNARRLTRRVGLGRAGFRSPPPGRPMHPASYRP